MPNPTADFTADIAAEAAGSSSTTAGGTGGTRSRAGNAMGRTREAALAGAVAAISKYGSRKATMGDIAMLAGIAKATLYNHFRTKDDVYAALVGAEVDAVAQAALGKLSDGFDVALSHACTIIAEHPAVRRVAMQEPAVAAALGAPGDGTAWASARSHVARALSEAGLDHSAPAVDLVLRFLASQVLAPSAPDETAAAAALITRAVAPPVTTMNAMPGSNRPEVRAAAGERVDQSHAEPDPGSVPADSSGTSS